jgi:hypothetical protein
MDIMDESLLKFWDTLNKYHVSYIMVGGFAVNMHGYTRATDDSDLWLKDDKKNRKGLRNTFKELGYGDYPSLETTQFVPGWTQFYIAQGIILDIMTSMKGLEHLDFDDCYKMAKIADLDGIKVPFLHINHLMANKEAVNRPKDQLDLIYLRKILSIIEENEKKKKEQEKD